MEPVLYREENQVPREDVVWENQCDFPPSIAPKNPHCIRFFSL